MPLMTDNNKRTIVGGGPKKVLYTLSTVRRIGLLNSGKALKSNNTCKACGLGMGGQKGGMTNEQNEFPSVCNKSIQAQSTDIQPPIPVEIFDHSLSELKELDGKEIESLGRLNTPLFKSSDSKKFEPVEWDWAIDYAAQKFSNSQPDQSFFYSSGRSSNEAGFILQLLARLYGTNNVNNCSYYCHQATGVGMANTIGTGTATVELEDLGGSDLIFVIGANPASNHPRFIYQLKACRDRGGEVIIINPAKEAGLVRFSVPKSARSMLSGGSWIASEYLQPKIGSDLALLNGLGKALIEENKIDRDYIEKYTENFEEYRRTVESTPWDEICQKSGVSQEDISRAANLYAQSKNTVFAWGMGITHHQNGVENVEAIVNLSLLRGMVGKRFSGLLPLRGHSNVQGIGTIGVKPVLPSDVFEKIEKQLGVTLPKTEGKDTLACLTAAHNQKMEAALIMGGNLFQATPDTRWAETAFNAIGFKLYLTTTLNLGHVHGLDEGEAIILPVTARDEERQPTTQESMFNYVRLSDGGIQRLSNPRPEVDILCDLAKRLIPKSTFDFTPFQSHKHIRQAIANIIPDLKELGNIDVAKKEFHIKNRLLHTPDFKRENRKAKFLASKHVDTFSKNFPFTLMSVRSEGQFNSIIYENKDSYRGTNSRWIVMMNKKDMEELGMLEGNTVTLCSAHGEMKNLLVHEFDLPQGNLMTYYPEANILIGREVDPRSKTPAFKSVSVSIKTTSSS